MTDSALFQMLMGGLTAPKPTNGGFIRPNQPNTMFPPGSPGYLLNMLFGPKAKAQDFINPNDVDFREGGSGALTFAQQQADQANGIIPGQETPSQYFARMSGQAAGIAPVAPGAPVAPKVIKPVAPIKPVKPVAPVKPVTATAPVTAPTNQGSLSGGFQTGEQFTAPPAPAPTPPPAVTPVQ
jgi:hypothetical protein